MPYDELLNWMAYFEKRPVGWRDDDRMAKLINTVRGLAGGKPEKPEKLFGSLQPIYHEPKEDREEGQLDIKNFKQSFLFNKILSSKGGVQLDVN